MSSKSKRRLKKRKVWLLLVLIILVVYVFQTLFNDWKQIYKNINNKNELAQTYDKLLEEQEKLESEVVKLQDPEYVLRYAREKYGYTRDNEIIIKINK